MTTGITPPWAPITFRLAGARDVELVQRFRYDVYIEQGFVAPDAFPEGRELDDYDAYAVSAVATAGATGEVVGTARLILSADGPLPIQSPPHAIRLVDPGRAAEISRLCVRREFRHGRVGVGLFRLLFQIIQQQCVDTVYAILDERLLGSLKDRSANGTSASDGLAGRIMRSNRRSWLGRMRPDGGGAAELPVHAQGRICLVGADRP